MCNQCKCTLDHGTGDLRLNCERHIVSNEHSSIVTSLLKQPLIDSVLPRSPAVAQPQFHTVVVHLCTGYRSRSVKYVSKRYNTVNVFNPFHLIHELRVPLPLLSLDDPTLIDLTVGDPPTWLPFSRGTPGTWYPHFRSTKSTGVWVEETMSVYDTPTAHVQYLCSHCRGIVFEDSVRHRLTRAARQQ